MLIHLQVFHTRFNLGFGSPKCDVCSTCVSYESKVKAGGPNIDVEKVEYKLHRKRAARFYQLLKESRKNKKTLTVSFDLQKILPVPKTPIGEAYYATQLNLYHFAIVIVKKKQLRKNVFLYTWTEDQSGKGSNEVVSALSNFFLRISKGLKYYRYEKIELFADSCAGQNKNKSMIAFLTHFTRLQRIKTPWLKEVKFYFPIRGHSYMPPDRVFGRIEQKLKPKALIPSPLQYYIF